MGPRRALPRLQISSPISPIEKRSYTSRPIRRAICILFLLTLAWLAVGRRLDSVGSLSTRNFRLIQGDFSDSSPSMWVGGGSVVSTTPINPDERLKQSSSGDSYTPWSDTLPDVIRIPFEEAVQDIKLDGWEDEWFSSGNFDARKSPLAEPKIDFIYNWVNGSDDAFKDIRHSYEQNSPLNDAEGKWISHHSINRYRDWGELRYSLRSLDLYAKDFVNRIQILVNSVSAEDNSTSTTRPQRPTWLKDDEPTNDKVQILSQESFFQDRERQCLPTFNSLSIESQIHNTPSNTDQFVALSDDMFLGMPHAPSDFYSPLFGSMMGFKSDHYNVKSLGSKDTWPSFGEKPFVYYTSLLLNRRFGERARNVQAHFGHSVSRAVMREAMASFPKPSSEAACERFRGESHFQIYPWYASFHYSIERFREALLWSFIMVRSDDDKNGYLDWRERQMILQAVEEGRKKVPSQDASSPAAESSIRQRMYYQLPEILQNAGLQSPKVNLDIQWTSLDGPATIRNLKCSSFRIDKCFADSFASPLSDATNQNPDFTASNVFSRLSYQHPKCGDCLLKFLLASAPRGLEPLLPPKRKGHDREVIVKALKKYQHTIIGTDAMKFVMVKDAEQAEMELLDRTIRIGKTYGQWCLNDDVMTESVEQVSKVKDIMKRVFETLWPKRVQWEREDWQD